MLWLHIILGVTISRDPLLQKAYLTLSLPDTNLTKRGNFHILIWKSKPKGVSIQKGIEYILIVLFVLLLNRVFKEYYAKKRPP